MKYKIYQGIHHIFPDVFLLPTIWQF